MHLQISSLIQLGKFGFSSWMWAKKNLTLREQDAIPKIHELINTDPSAQWVKIYAIISDKPSVTINGTASLSNEQQEEAGKIRPNLSLNEIHALAENWNGMPTASINARTCDFAELTVLRNYAKKTVGARPPNVISCGAVVVCPESKKIILHRRSASSSTYPGKLHILGGAYQPPQKRIPFDIPGDRDNLDFTMIREIFEESGTIIRPFSEPVCVAEEVDTGFIQYVSLGVRITNEQCKQIKENDEGDIFCVSFKQLPRLLQDSRDWVPTGRAHLLMWLALGAPGAGLFPRFDGASPKELFSRIVG